MSAPDVLVLGGSGAGKTHFAGQLLGRMRHDRKGKLRIRPGGVEDLSKLEEVLGCLEEGRAAGHTPAETWTGIRCELETVDGEEVLLEWPEYAGERLFAMVERRLIPEEWRDSIHSATGWLLFIRPSTLKLYEDILDRPTGIVPEHSNAQETSVQGSGWDDRARYVELLQMLLFAAAQSTFRPIKKPRLAIVLSCWDELNGNQSTPESLFAERLPLLNAFVRSSWKQDSWSVWGLSSLGRPLSQHERDEDFAMRGPENFGYVIRSGSTDKEGDLTAPVAWLLEI
jgi:Double-GTPase 1